MRDLLTKATAQTECVSDAREIFKIKYNQTHIKFYGPLLADDGTMIKEDGNRKFIFFQNFNAIKNVLRIFGDLMQTIEISFEKMGMVESREIINHINNCCSSTISNLTVKNCKENVLDNLKGTFQNVRSLTLSTLSTSKLDISSQSIKLNQTFPNLNRLHLGSTKDTDWILIDGVFSELIHLNVMVPRTFKNKSRPIDSHVLNLLHSNSQIETLTLGQSTLKLLNKASTLLHLRALKLNGLSDKYFNYKGGPIRFDTLETLSIAMDRRNAIPENVKFIQIKTLILNIGSKFDDKWIDFINKQINGDIIELKLYAIDINVANLRSIAEHLSTLKRASIECSRMLSANEIVGFLGIATKLIQFELKIRISDAEESKLYKNVEGWTISSRTFDGNKISITLER